MRLNQGDRKSGDERSAKVSFRGQKVKFGADQRTSALAPMADISRFMTPWRGSWIGK